MTRSHWTPATAYLDASHECIRQEDDPILFEYYRLMIAHHGVLENLTLSGRIGSYRCYYGADGYKYWTIGAILGRAKV